MMIITRKEAKERGLKRYYTGVPCSKGHFSERRVSNKKCVKCVKEGLEKYRQTDKCRQQRKEYAYNVGTKIKNECLSHYSHKEYPICANPECHCPGGVTDIRVLDLDHINGGGNTERREHTGQRGGGVRWYKWLKKQGYPPGHRVLCKNCNWLAWLERKNED